MGRELIHYSKLLSRVLRHKPESMGLRLDRAGWVDIDTLLTAMHAHGIVIDRALLDRVVAENDKQRFSYSPDGLRIRANQGHSIPVDLELPPRMPPELLYHGTAAKNLNSIREQGLLKG